MEALTIESITQTANKNILHPSTITYIQVLLKPYAEAVDYGNDVNGIMDWVPQVFPGQFGIQIISAIEQIVAQYPKYDRPTDELLPMAQLNTIEHYTDQCVTSVKMAVIAYLIRELTSMEQSSTIFPWNIQTHLSKHEVLSTMLDISPLPISITINNKSFQHTVGEEFIAGLLIFSAANNVDFNVTMLNAPIKADDVIQEKFVFNDKQNYSVDVKSITYGFNTTEFMRGFMTAASWSKVDHRTQWSTLSSYYTDENTQELMMTPLTF